MVDHVTGNHVTGSNSPLIAAYNTISGVLGPVPARHGFGERVAAAAAAGFAGIGLAIEDYLALRAAGWTEDRLLSTLEAHRIEIPEIEFLHGWAASDTLDEATAAREQTAAEMARLFGARHVLVGDLGEPGTLPPEEAVAARLTALGQRMAPHGLLVALEFWPMGSIAGIEQASRLVQLADSENVGLLVDSWHYGRSGSPEAALRAVPPDRIVAIHLADADAEVLGTLWEDTMERRRLPGEGALELERFVRALAEMGVDAPLSVEVIATDQAALPVREAAERAAAATRALLPRAL